MDKKTKQWFRQIARTDAIAKQLERFFNEAAKEAIRIGYSVKADPDKIFSFDQYPRLRDRANRLFKKLFNEVNITIQNGISEAWNQAEIDTNEMTEELFRSLNNPRITKEVISTFQGRNIEGLKAFQGRKTDNLRLSDRVWRACDLHRKTMELVVDEGIATGRSAVELSQDVRGYLNDPLRLHRRVKNRRGALVESKAMAEFQPQPGVYKSAYKNAFRLARTEINMAYREADYQKWQSLDFVVGMEVRRSNNPYPCPVCEKLKGRYPKNFRFPGWHPQCRCHVVSILASREEMNTLTEMILNDEELSGFKSENEVKEIPKEYRDWLKENQKRILTARSKPYFIAYNYKDGDIRKGLRFAGN